jgi:sigma-B regulation protein RsbU (phosphoserine phosphatase)
MFLARLDTVTGQLVYCNAGHPEPLLLRANGAVKRLHHGGPVLGAVPSATYENASLDLTTGDVLVGYSDGLSECRDDRDEEFGEQGILSAMKAAQCASASRLLFSVVGAAQDFAGSQLREDDFGLLVVRHNGQCM